MDKLMKAATMSSDLVDLTYLDWLWCGISQGSHGTLPKAVDWNANPRQFYKASKYNMADGFIGYESIYEVICCRIFKQLGIDVVDQTLLDAKIKLNGKVYETTVCRSDDFNIRGSNKISFERLLLQVGVEPFEFAIKDEVVQFFVDMVIADYIICQYDRHGANIEFYVGAEVKPAPLFDNGSCLFVNMRDESRFSLLKYDDPYTNSVFGYMKLSQLLNKFRPYLSNSSIDKSVSINWNDVFSGIRDYLSKTHIDSIMELVEYRLGYVKSLL